MWAYNGDREGLGGVKTTYEIRGLNLDRLIDFAKKRGITLYNAKKFGNKRLIVSVSLKESKKFFAITKELCYNIKKVREEGVFYPVLKLYRSVGILLGAILIICSAFYFDTLIFSTEYSGTGSMYKRQVQEYIESVGVKRFAKFSSFDLDALADGILADNPHLSFASCQKKGKTLKISLVLSQDKVDRLSGDSIALYSDTDGIIESVKVYRGTAVCAVGQSVKENDLLVDGYSIIKGERVETNVIAVVSIIAQKTFNFTFDGEDFSNQALIVAEEKLNGATVLEKIVTKERIGKEFLYTVTLKYRTVKQVG